ncbi:MAG: response regulator [Clostridiales bacterium]|nr:response regulator [Clostridiales bacterium]
MKIVIVEDEVRIREGIEKLLSKRATEHQVVGMAENGKEGFALILQEKPELVIADIKMPLMDGIQMLAAVREAGITIKAIILSAYSEFAYAQQALKLGVSEYLLKPIVVDELMQAINSIETQLKGSKTQSILEVRQILPEILHSISHSSSDALETTQVGMLVGKARKIAEENFHDGITLNEIADILSVTPEHLGSQIHKELGITFGTMMKALRINKAKDLLLSTEMKLYEIAEMVGYQDPKYFAKIFQSDIGVMPLEFRKLHKMH